MRNFIAFRMFNAFFLAVLLVGLLIFMGCVEQVKLCDQVPEGETSLLCQASRKFGLDLETVAGGLKIANAGALATDRYTATEALAFIDRVSADLVTMEKAGSTYAMFIQYLHGAIDDLPPVLVAAFAVVVPYVDTSVPELSKYKLQPYDYYLLRLHLERQRTVVLPFTLLE